MRKRLQQVVLALLFGLVPPITASAQAVRTNPGQINAKLPTEQSKGKKVGKDFQPNPLLTKVMQLHPNYSPFPVVGQGAYRIPGQRRASGALFANASTTIWGNLAIKEDWTSTSYGPFGY